MSFFKRIFIGVLLVLFACFNAGAKGTFTARLPLYAASSNLSSGKWVKIRVSQNGIYKLTFNELKAMGFANPGKVRVFGYGGNLLSETLNADYIDDVPEVNTYLGDSFILFYAVGPVRWNYSSYTNRFSFTKNSCSDYGYYFLSDVEGSRRSVPAGSAVVDSSAASINLHYECALYSPSLTNPYNGGSNWFDTPIAGSGSKNLSFPFSNLVSGNYGYASFSSVVIGAGSRDKNQVVLTSADYSTTTYSSSLQLTKFTQRAASNLPFNIDFSSSSSTANFYLNYLSVSALCGNRLANGYLHFNNVDTVGAVGQCNIMVANADASTVVWNVTDPQNITTAPSSLSGGTLKCVCGSSSFSDFIAFNPSSNEFLSVDSSYSVVNQDLHSLNGADIVIITHPAFYEQAQRLAALHASSDGFSSCIVTPEQIYNEFSSGTPDPTAFRAFIKMLYDRGKADSKRVLPRYVLLFGDGCFDNRGVLSSSYGSKHNFILTYQAGVASANYVNDAYFGLIDDNTANFNMLSDTCYVAIGRLPVTTALQAEEVVDKIANYMKNDYYGSWKTKAVIVADDNESSTVVLSSTSTNDSKKKSYNEFITLGEALADSISMANPDVVIKKVYYDAYTRVSEASGYRYLDVENAITDNVEDGTMFINYIGHSNSVNWSAEKTFTQNQVSSLTNKKLGIWFAASCEFSEFDSYSTSCAESLVLAPNGGAIAVLASPRETYSSSSQLFNVAFAKGLFSQTEGETLGDYYRRAVNSTAKITRYTSRTDTAWNDIRFYYPLLGDPALRIVFPNTEYKVYTDSISADTLKALSRVSVKGHVGSQNSVLSSFNGNVNVVVYDKLTLRNTKGNPNSSWATTFKDYPTVVYSGNAEVVDGQFSFNFIVPADIRCNYGNGRIVYYAYDSADSIDVSGSTSDFIIGGVSDSIPSDSVGPVIKAYINSSAFRSGDVVGSNPVFVAEVSDENGINASGVGVGHDITLSVNGADNEILNDYFSYSMRSSSNGRVVYPLSSLPDGVYTLTFKVWDLLNNSSTQSLSFRVVSGISTHINQISAYPSPAEDFTTIKVCYDRPLTDVDYTVSIYNLNGVLLNSFSGSDNTSDAVLSLQWNLTDAAGRRVEPGVYVCRVDVKMKDGDSVGSAAKVVVLPAE